MKIVPTTTQNLVKDGATRIYYACLKIRGRTNYRSLDTTVAATAKLCLQDKLKEIRESFPSDELTGALEAKATFEDVATLYTTEITNNPRMQPSTKEVRLRPITTLRRTWPELFQTELRRVTPVSIKHYIAEFERGKWPYLPNGAKAKSVAGNSASTFNKLVTCMRETFELAVKVHVIAKNPAADLTHKPPRKKLLQLPNKSQFKKIVEHIRRKSGKGRIAADLVEGLAYSGLRLEEANSLLWHDLDHERRMIAVKGTKTEGSIVAQDHPISVALAAPVLGISPFHSNLELSDRTHQKQKLRSQFVRLLNRFVECAGSAERHPNRGVETLRAERLALSSNAADNFVVRPWMLRPVGHPLWKHQPGHDQLVA